MSEPDQHQPPPGAPGIGDEVQALLALTLQAGEPVPRMILPDEAAAVLRCLPPAGRTGPVADLLKEIIHTGRDPRLFTGRDPAVPPLPGQYATPSALNAAVSRGELIPTEGSSGAGGYRSLGQCSGLQTGGEGPRGRAARPERALASRLFALLGHRDRHDGGDPAAVVGHVDDLPAYGHVVQGGGEVLAELSGADLVRHVGHVRMVTLVYALSRERHEAMPPLLDSQAAQRVSQKRQEEGWTPRAMQSLQRGTGSCLEEGQHRQGARTLSHQKNRENVRNIARVIRHAAGRAGWPLRNLPEDLPYWKPTRGRSLSRHGADSWTSVPEMQHRDWPSGRKQRDHRPDPGLLDKQRPGCRSRCDSHMRMAARVRATHRPRPWPSPLLRAARPRVRSGSSSEGCVALKPATGASRIAWSARKTGTRPGGAQRSGNPPRRRVFHAQRGGNLRPLGRRGCQLRVQQPRVAHRTAATMIRHRGPGWWPYGKVWPSRQALLAESGGVLGHPRPGMAWLADPVSDPRPETGR